MKWSRREMCAALASLFAFPSAVAKSQSPAPVASPAVLPGKVYIFDQLKPHSESSMTPGLPPIVLRDLIRGNIRTGLPISLHESVMGPHGIPSHPPHKHRHEEMIMVIEGMLDFNLNGVITRGGPGSVMYSGPWDLHGITNPQATDVKYFVLELGDEKGA